MIRRKVGDEFWLITQNDHAIVSGVLAEQIGGEAGFTRPEPSAVSGTALHDCGWPLHDERPTLNERNLPLDVFETPRHIGLMVWTESSERAAQEDPYAGLLVSLHSLSLSVMATTPTAVVHEKFDMSDAAARFELNRFQQSQIELQEDLRRRLGMRTDEPRKFGLGETSTDPREEQLIFDFRLLQAMDKLSLAICCTAPPIDVIEPLPAAPGGTDRPLRIRRTSETDLCVSPWPFRIGCLSVMVPFRRLPAEPFLDGESFRRAYAAAPVERFKARVTPG